MRILLTGATGFIGKNILEQLGKKYRFWTPTHQELELEDKNAVDVYFAKNKIDLIINCAGYGIYGVEIPDMVERNVRVFLNLAGKNVPMIHLGSGAEYNKNYSLVRVREEDFGRSVPTDKYGFSKYIMSLYIQRVSHIVCLRPFGVFGKYEDPERRFISNAINRVINGESIIIYRDTLFDYLYVNDLVRIVEHFINSLDFRFDLPLWFESFFNVSRGETISLKEIAMKINRLAKKRVPIKLLHKGMGAEYSGDNSRLMKRLKYFQFTTFDVALKELFDWYNKKK